MKEIRLYVPSRDFEVDPNAVERSPTNPIQWEEHNTPASFRQEQEQAPDGENSSSTKKKRGRRRKQGPVPSPPRQNEDHPQPPPPGPEPQHPSQTSPPDEVSVVAQYTHVLPLEFKQPSPSPRLLHRLLNQTDTDTNTHRRPGKQLPSWKIMERAEALERGEPISRPPPRPVPGHRRPQAQQVYYREGPVDPFEPDNEIQNSYEPVQDHSSENYAQVNSRVMPWLQHHATRVAPEPLPPPSGGLGSTSNLNATQSYDWPPRMVQPPPISAGSGEESPIFASEAGSARGSSYSHSSAGPSHRSQLPPPAIRRSRSPPPPLHLGNNVPQSHNYGYGSDTAMSGLDSASSRSSASSFGSVQRGRARTRPMVAYSNNGRAFSFPRGRSASTSSRHHYNDPPPLSSIPLFEGGGNGGGSSAGSMASSMMSSSSFPARGRSLGHGAGPSRIHSLSRYRDPSLSSHGSAYHSYPYARPQLEAFGSSEDVCMSSAPGSASSSMSSFHSESGRGRSRGRGGGRGGIGRGGGRGPSMDGSVPRHYSRLSHERLPSSAGGGGRGAYVSGSGGVGYASGNGGGAYASGSSGGAYASGSGGSAYASGSGGDAYASGSGGGAYAIGSGGSGSASGNGGFTGFPPQISSYFDLDANNSSNQGYFHGDLQQYQQQPPQPQPQLEQPQLPLVSSQESVFPPSLSAHPNDWFSTGAPAPPNPSSVQPDFSTASSNHYPLQQQQLLQPQIPNGVPYNQEPSNDYSNMNFSKYLDNYGGAGYDYS